MTTIDSFPRDNIDRVVYLYSCIKLNNSPESENILVEVLLIETDIKNPNRLNISNTSYEKYDVTFRDLDSVQIGSIWKGQTLIEERKFTFNHCLKKITFEFDFSINKPSVIKFNEKRPDSDDFYLFNEKIFIPKGENNVVLKKYYPFLMSKYCLLTTTNNNIEVFTNCIHALHAFYIPSRKDIRGHLINDSYSFSRIVDQFFNSYEKKKFEDIEKFIIILNKKYYKQIGKEGIVFLANLALNKATQDTVSKIRTSLNDVKLDKNNKPYPSRFPSVVPPHSKKMRITAEGYWLEEGKQFLITHTTNITPISDYPITVYAPKTESKDNEEDIEKPERKNRQNRQKKEQDSHIDTRNDPSHTRGENTKQTDIEVDLNDFDIEIIEEITETELNTLYKIQHEKKEEKDNTASSGDRYGNRKNRPKKSENTEKNIDKSKINMLTLIFDSLQEMKKQKASHVTQVYSIDKYGNSINDYSLLQLSFIIESENYRPWVNSNKGRKIMFLKIELNNFDDHLYLIDIKKNIKNESNCVFLFISKIKLDNKDIKKICEAIAGKKGTKKWLENKNIDLYKKKAIMHKYTTKADWMKVLNSFFNRLADGQQTE